MADMADAPGGGSLAFTAPSLQLSMRFGGKTAPAGIRARRPDWAGVFRTAVNPLRCAVPAPRKPWVTFHGHPRDACVARLGAAGKTSCFSRSGKRLPNPASFKLG